MAQIYDLLLNYTNIYQKKIKKSEIICESLSLCNLQRRSATGSVGARFHNGRVFTDAISPQPVPAGRMTRFTSPANLTPA